MTQKNPTPEELRFLGEFSRRLSKEVQNPDVDQKEFWDQEARRAECRHDHAFLDQLTMQWRCSRCRYTVTVNELMQNHDASFTIPHSPRRP